MYARCLVKPRASLSSMNGRGWIRRFAKEENGKEQVPTQRYPASLTATLWSPWQRSVLRRNTSEGHISADRRRSKRERPHVPHFSRPTIQVLHTSSPKPKKMQFQNYVNPSIPKHKTFDEYHFTKWLLSDERFQKRKWTINLHHHHNIIIIPVRQGTTSSSTRYHHHHYNQSW